MNIFTVVLIQHRARPQKESLYCVQLFQTVESPYHVQYERIAGALIDN